MKRPVMEGLYQMIERQLTKPVDCDDDKLLFSALAEVKERMAKALENATQVSTVSFTPTQALAIRIFYTDYILEFTSYMGNHLHQISNEVHDLYKTQP